MGTSKGYIAPTRTEWTQAKRAVTSMLRNNDSESISKAGSRFATAMKTDTPTGSTFTTAAAQFLSLSKNISHYSTSYALNQIHRLDLLDKPPDEILDELFHEYTNNGETIEDALSADALSKALSNLQIEELDQLGNISLEVFLKEMLIDYITINFDFRFAEKIGKDRTPAETRRILNEMQNYIRSSLYEKLNFGDIDDIDFSNLSGNDYIDKALIDAYAVFEELYTEE